MQLMSKPKGKIKLTSKRALVRLAILGVILSIIVGRVWFVMIKMPGKSYAGELPPLTPQEQLLQEELRVDVTQIGNSEHNYVFYDRLVETADFLSSELAAAGYEVNRQGYEVNKQLFENLEAELPGTDKADEIIVIGAHYDSVVGAPGANDNGTGAAAVLALARAFRQKPTSRTLRFVEFVNEEPPFFWTENMGSLVYAKGCRDSGDNIVAMLSLETMGYFSDAPGSQAYPFPLNLTYPLTGNFIAFVGNMASGKLLRNAIGSFRRHTQFPSEGAVLPNALPGVGWSDNWSFWQQGYPAIMVTDTAPFRYPYYHTAEDTPDKVDYARLARVVAGLERVIAELGS